MVEAIAIGTLPWIKHAYQIISHVYIEIVRTLALALILIVLSLTLITEAIGLVEELAKIINHLIVEFPIVSLAKSLVIV